MITNVEITLEPGEILYHEGEANESGYIIESGEVLLTRGSGEARIVCERRGPGSIIGELSLLTGRPRSVTVEAVTKCKIFRIPGEQILSRFKRLDPVLKACIETSIAFAETLASSTARSFSSEHPLVSGAIARTTVHNADELIERFKLERDIAASLVEGHFSMVYQPIVNLGTIDIVGVEALMRWQHPEYGAIPPDKFISVAETSGLIEQLTDYALSEGCRALKRLKVAHPEATDLFMCVNISGHDMERAGFADFVAHVLESSDLRPRDLKLEVTETALVPDSSVSQTNLVQLKRMGCGISIDDFGTGYSNLGYLKNLPLTTLKIDRSFAGQACNSDVSRSIVRMLVGLGDDLAVDVIAEGVETRDDADALAALGCRLAQGYFFFKPMVETALSELVSGTDGVLGAMADRDNGVTPSQRKNVATRH